MRMDSGQALKMPTVEMALRLALDELESRLEEADISYADAQWRRHFNRTGQDELHQLEAARSTVLLDERAWETLDHWERRLRDQSLARRAVLLTRRFRWAQIESRPEVYELRNRIDQTILTFRPHETRVGKPISRTDRAEILRQHPDRARRRDAWLAMAPLAAQIEADVRELMRRRENLARELGYEGFVSWALDVRGLSCQWVIDLLEELRRLTDAPYRGWLIEAARRLSVQDGLRPWDLAFAAESTALLPDVAFPRDGLLQAVQGVAEGLGLGPEAAGVQVDVVDIPYAALCYAVHPPADVRILLNPRDGYACYRVLFHEFGHALHQRCLQPMSPALRNESPPFNEAMACLWERLASEPDWLIEHSGVALEHGPALRRLWAGRTLYRLRALLAQAAFESRAYQDPDGDLLFLFRDTLSEYLQVPFDEAAGWADSPFWTSHPIYVQNYVIAEIVASQTLVALKRHFGRLIGEPQVGAWLVENYYALGGGLAWTDKVVRATGVPLSSADLIAELTDG